MGTGQSQPRIQAGNALDTSETTSNVGTNKAELEALRAASVDGRDIYPKSTQTDHLYATDGVFQGYMKAGALAVGSGGVSISSAADGATPTTGLLLTDSVLQLIKDNAAVVSLDGTTGAATFKGTVAAGSTISGTMTAGTISVGAGGVTIGDASAGVCIAGNQIFVKTGGATTILLDGATGILTCSKVSLTTDASSTVTMNSGTVNLGNSVQVGGTTTLGGMQTATSDAQSTANTANTAANNAQTTANGRLLAGGGVVEDGSHYITRINTTSGIVVSTATSDTGARTQMTSAGIAIYNSGGSLVVQCDHTNGVFINTLSDTPGVPERLSLAYNGTEKCYAYTGSNKTVFNSQYPIEFACSYLALSHDGDAQYILSGPAPTQDASTSYPKGSIWMGTGGSVWVVNGSNQWDRLRTFNYNP
ncbi:MAG: hypothetical protein M1274_15375 [Actinobacteria bacterium]|nr:hypothetical protein [Actinomycetota bacterium]